MVQHTDKIVQNLLKLATSRSCSTSRNFFSLNNLIFKASLPPAQRWYNSSLVPHYKHGLDFMAVSSTSTQFQNFLTVYICRLIQSKNINQSFRCVIWVGALGDRGKFCGNFQCKGTRFTLSPVQKGGGTIKPGQKT